MREREEAALSAAVDALTPDEREWRMIVLELDFEQLWNARHAGLVSVEASEETLDGITTELALLMGEIP